LSIYFCLLKTAQSTRNESTKGGGGFSRRGFVGVWTRSGLRRNSQKLKSVSRAEFSVRQERQGSPLFPNEAGARLNVSPYLLSFSELLFFSPQHDSFQLFSILQRCNFGYRLVLAFTHKSSSSLRSNLAEYYS
jgi:hypothetical protein